MAEIMLPSCAITGLGYLGRPLAQKFYEQGCTVAALKRKLTSDDINLPIQLDIADLNHLTCFDEPFWQYWADKKVWYWLLPPSALENYIATLQKWVEKAEHFAVEHIIFTSSISVYGNAVRECNEFTQVQADTPSAAILLEAEHLVLQSRISHVDILRLGGLYSSERHPLNRLLLQTNIAGGCKPVNMLHQNAAVDILLHTATQAQGKRIRNAVEAAHPSRKDFYTAEAIKLGMPIPDFDLSDTANGKIVNTVFTNTPSR